MNYACRINKNKHINTSTFKPSMKASSCWEYFILFFRYLNQFPHFSNISIVFKGTRKQVQKDRTCVALKTGGCRTHLSFMATR